MKLSSKLHDAWHGFTFWIDGEWQYYKRYWPELRQWLLAGISLCLLVAIISFSIGRNYCG